MSIPFDAIELIRNAIARSERAWTQIYDKYRDVMLQVAKRYTDCAEDAEELVNDAFFYCYRDIDQFRYYMKGGFEGWMKKVLRNTCLNYLKSKKNKQPNGALTEDVDVGIPAPQISMITTEELKGHINRLLTPRCREVFYRFVLEKSTHKEIAAIMGMKQKTSRVHLHDAKKILKEKLGPLYNIDHRDETGTRKHKFIKQKDDRTSPGEYDAVVR